MSSKIFSDRKDLDYKEKVEYIRRYILDQQPPAKAELGEGETPIPYEYLPRDHFKGNIIFPRGRVVGDPAPTPKPATEEVPADPAKRVRMRDWKQQ